MFVVTEAEAAAIRATFEQQGELSAAVELRRLFPAITDNVQARECARTIASWKPLPSAPRPVRRLHQDRGRKALNRRTRARNLRGDQLGLAAPVDDIVVAEFGGVSLFKERPTAIGGPSASERDPIGSLCRQGTRR
jgi:hypothetical protein